MIYVAIIAWLGVIAILPSITLYFASWFLITEYAKKRIAKSLALIMNALTFGSFAIAYMQGDYKIRLIVCFTFFILFIIFSLTEILDTDNIFLDRI